MLQPARESLIRHPAGPELKLSIIKHMAYTRLKRSNFPVKFIKTKVSESSYNNAVYERWT